MTRSLLLASVILAVAAFAAPYLEVVVPNAETVWIMDEVVEVEWDMDDEVYQYDLAKLTLIRGDKSWVIDEETENDGWFLWDVPTEIEAGEGYQVKIDIIGQTGLTAMSQKFKISCGEFRVIEPSEFDPPWDTNTASYVRWDRGCRPETVKMNLYVLTEAGNPPKQWTVKEGFDNTGELEVKVAFEDIVSGMYRFKLCFADDGKCVESELFELIKKDEPYFVILYPTASVVWPLDSFQFIKWAMDDDTMWDVYYVSIKLIHGTDEWMIAQDTENDGEFIVELPGIETLKPAEDYQVKIEAVDVENVVAVSQKFAIKCGVFHIEAPNAKDPPWDVSAVGIVRWDKACKPAEAQLNLSLLDKDGAKEVLIKKGLENSGIAHVKLPKDTAPGQYKFKLTFNVDGSHAESDLIEVIKK